MLPIGADDRVVAVAVGVAAFGDQQRRGSRRGVALVAVGAVDGQAVGVEADVLVDPAVLVIRMSSRPAASASETEADNGFQSLASIHDVTSSSTSARSGSLNTSWYSSG